MTISNSPSRGQRLGPYIRAKREAAGIGLRELERRSGVLKGTLSKLENGLVDEPRAAHLDRIARALDISMAELHDAAGYASALPSLPVYLRSQSKHLSDEEQAALTRQVLAVTRRYGLHGHRPGPAAGEDETD